MRFQFNRRKEWGSKALKEEEHLRSRGTEIRRQIEDQMDEVTEMATGTVYRVQNEFPHAEEIDVDRVITLLNEFKLCEQGGPGVCPECDRAVADAVLLIEVAYGDR